MVFHRAIALLVLAVISAGCQTQGPERDTVSPEEAKKTPIIFRSGNFIPPPRTIRDITATLDQYKPDPVVAAQTQELADQPPPQTSDPDILRKFYYERGIAAGRIGRARQRIEDLKKAVEYAAKASKEDEAFLLLELSIAEGLAGKRADSLAHRIEAIKKTPHEGAKLGYGSGLAVVYARSGDMQEAYRALGEAKGRFEALRFRPQPWATWGDHWTGLFERAQANVLDAAGKYAEAERAYRASLKHQAVPKPAGARLSDAANWVYDLTISELARTLANQGRVIEAEVEARKALAGLLRLRGRYSVETALVLTSLIEAIIEQGRYQEAEQLARIRVDIYRGVGAIPTSRTLAWARQQLATTFIFQERWQDALAEFQGILKDFNSEPESQKELFRDNPGWPLTLIKTGQAKEAVGVAEQMLRRRIETHGERHARTAVARGILAMALADTGERKPAFAEFAKSVPILLPLALDRSEGGAGSTRLQQYLRWILEAYIKLLAEIYQTDLEKQMGMDAAAEAFRLADAGRAPTVQRAISEAAARGAINNPELADLVRREQDAGQQIPALTLLLTELLSSKPEEQDSKVVETLRNEIAQHESTRFTLKRDIEKRFPSYANLVNPKPAGIEEARKALRSGEALLSLFVTPERVYVWAVPKDGRIAFTIVHLGEKELRATVARLRKALDPGPGATSLGYIPQFDAAEAHALYVQLLKPVEAGWKDASNLLVVAHGPLGQLPLALLPTQAVGVREDPNLLFAEYRNVPWLVRKLAVTQLPSVNALVTLRALPAGDANRRAFAGFGDPFFSKAQAAETVKTEKPMQTAALGTRGMPLSLRNQPKLEGVDSSELALLPRLPDTADEIKTIAQTLNADISKDVFLGAQANEKTVKTADLKNRRIVVFATHGLVPGDLNGLTQPALALTSPEVAGVDGDGLLTMEEVLGLKLDADWVVLSACNTAAGQGAGAEAISGLGRAFFYAGARSLLVTNWPVETTSARFLTTEIFRRQAQNPSLTRAEALRQTMLAMIESAGLNDPKTGKAVFSYAHPIFWAPFALIGDGGG